MALNPIDYSISGDPIQAFYKSYDTGLANQSALETAQAQRGLLTAQAQEVQQKTIADNLKAQALQQQQQQANDAFLKLKDPNATADDYRNASLFLPKDQSEAALKIWESKDKQEKQNLLTNASQVFAALHSGNQQLAQDKATEAQLAYENSGDTNNAKALGTWLETIKTSPQIAKAMLGATIGGLPEGSKILEFLLGKPQADVKKTEAETQSAIATTAKTKADTTGQNISNLYAPQKTALDLQNTQSTIAKNTADIANTQSQIDERGYKISNPALSTTAEKLINDSVEKINTNSQAINNIKSIQSSIDVLKNQYGGAWTKAGDFTAKFFGSDGEWQNIKAQLAQVNFDKIKSNKLAGAYSDKDVDLVKTTTIDETSDSAVIERYLVSTKKILEADNKIQQNQADWVSANGNLGTARKDLEINGVLIPRGTKFSEFNKAPATSKSYLKY